MSKTKRKTKAAPNPIACPKCGGSEIAWQEWIPSTREILGIKDGRILVASDSYQDDGLDADGDGELFCRDCAAEFPIPSALTVHHDDARSLAAILRGEVEP